MFVIAQIQFESEIYASESECGKRLLDLIRESDAKNREYDKIRLRKQRASNAQLTVKSCNY